MTAMTAAAKVEKRSNVARIDDIGAGLGSFERAAIVGDAFTTVTQLTVGLTAKRAVNRRPDASIGAGVGYSSGPADDPSFADQGFLWRRPTKAAAFAAQSRSS